MKILITSDWYAPTVNGVVTSVLNLQRGLEAMGHEVRILTLSETAHSRTEGPVTAIGAIGAGRIYPGAVCAPLPGRSSYRSWRLGSRISSIPSVSSPRF